MNIVMVANLALVTLIVYLATRLAILVTPRGLDELFGGNDQNDLGSRKQWLFVVVVSFGFVGMMSVVLAVIAHPEWLASLDELLKPVEKWLESFITSAALTVMTGLVVLLIMMLCGIILKDDIKRLRLPAIVCIFAVVIGSIVMAAKFDNWLVGNILGIVFITTLSISLQQRVSFLRLALFMNIVAFAYDFVQVYLTDNMVKASSNLEPGLPGTQNSATHEVISSLRFPSLLYIPTEWTMQPIHNYMLGLGDVLSGILMAAAAARLGKQIDSRLPILLGVAGFGLGIFAAFAMLLWFDHAQPALIFIVPITSILVISYMKFGGHTAVLKQKPWTVAKKSAQQ